VVRREGVVVPLAQGNQRALLATLLWRAGQAVSVDELAAAMWGETPPPSAVVTIRNYVKRLRKALGDDEHSRIRTQPPGYLVAVRADELDVSRFERLLRAAQTAAGVGSWHIAAEHARAALSLWRGRPLLDVESTPLVQQEVLRLTEMHAQAVETRIDSDLHCGSDIDVIAELAGLVDANPLRERLPELLMRALCQDGREAEALAVYQRARQILIDQLGTEPGPPLRELHQRILNGDLDHHRASPPVLLHAVPPRNPFFIGRDAILQQIHNHLRGADTRAVAVVPLHGMAGVGKTQLALEYVHRYAADYRLVCWINSDSAPLATAALAGLAADLGLATDGLPDVVIARLWQALARRDDWLLVYDNVDDPADAARLHPPDTGRLLITGRSPTLARLSPVVLEVAPFQRTESVRLLTLRCPSLSPAQADLVAAATDDLPLAVEQAGCFLEDSGISVADYLDLLSSQPTRAGLADPTLERHSGLTTVVAAARGRLAATCPAAAELLDQMSFLAPEPLSLTAQQGPRRSGVRAGDVAATADVVRHLTGLALVRRSTATTIQMHRLIRAVLRAQVSDSAAIRFAARQLLGTAAPGDPNDPTTWPAYASLTPHALALTADPVDAEEPPSFRSLVTELMRYLFASAQYADLRTLAQRCHPLWADTLGPDHIDTLGAANSLALAVFELGEYAEARDLHQDNYERARRVLGPDHEYTLRSASNLIVALFGLGEYAAARDLGRVMVPRRRALLGDDHLNTLRSISNLAAALHELGEYDEARDLYQEALDRSKQVLGVDHPNTLRTANNLGVTLFELGEYTTARLLQQDTLNRRSRLLGAGNSTTLTTAANLVEVLTAMGELEAACTLGRNTMERFGRALGADHPLALGTATYLVVALTESGDYQAAYELGRDTFDRSRRALGADHPYTLGTADSLVVVLTCLGDHTAARALGEDTVARFGRALGADHPHTRRAADHLAAVLSIGH
jgi:DNA-binding SARP family transcriptional activator